MWSPSRTYRAQRQKHRSVWNWNKWFYNYLKIAGRSQVSRLCLEYHCLLHSWSSDVPKSRNSKNKMCKLIITKWFQCQNAEAESWSSLSRLTEMTNQWVTQITGLFITAYQEGADWLAGYRPYHLLNISFLLMHCIHALHAVAIILHMKCHEKMWVEWM